MPEMPTTESIQRFLFYEDYIRLYGPVLEFQEIDRYWVDLLLLLSFFKARANRDTVSQARVLEAFSNMHYLPVVAKSSLGARRAVEMAVGARLS